MLFEQPLRYAVRTDVGLRRQNNEDASAVRLASSRQAFEKHGHLLLVADGMGGHAVGELASGIASEVVPQDYLRDTTGGDPAERLAAAVTRANAAIFAKGAASPDFARMGTTCTALALTPQGAAIAHVGDSRCYRVRGTRCDQLTFDHSLQWELIRQGMDPETVMLNEPRNVITRSLGPSEDVAVDVEGPFAALPGDVYVLCSDGLTGHVHDHEIGAIAGGLPPEDAAKALVNLANLRGGSDNTTVVVASVGEIPAGVAQKPPGDPTRPINPWLLAAAWALTAVLVTGVGLLLFQRYIEGTLVTGFGGILLAAAGFRIWQRWYRRPRERPLHTTGQETAVWRAYRSAPATVDRSIVAEAGQVAAQLQRTAAEEEWNLDAKRV
ncbi:MAG: protein phosphatase 2C domain-containing protein, partial [Planctomycetota bacterium]